METTNKSFDSVHNHFNSLMLKIINPEEHMKVFSFIIENNNTQSKFLAIQNVLNNIFLSSENKEYIFNIFNTTQKIRHSFSKLLYIYKFKKATVKIEKDLLWNDIDVNNNNNNIIIFQNNAKYLFTLRDLRILIINSITNFQNGESNPTECKNPFNNLPFTKSNLYNIYFALRKSNMPISVIIHQYFLCDFDLELFKIENEVLIIDNYVEKYMNTSSNEILFDKIVYMLKKYQPKVRIDVDFPKEQLIRIMKPYLYLFIIYINYPDGIDKKRVVDILLKKLFKGFYCYNPLFGKKKYVKEFGNNNYKMFYESDHPRFTLQDIKKINFNFNNMEDDQHALFTKPYKVKPYLVKTQTQTQTQTQTTSSSSRPFGFSLRNRIQRNRERNNNNTNNHVFLNNLIPANMVQPVNNLVYFNNHSTNNNNNNTFGTYNYINTTPSDTQNLLINDDDEDDNNDSDDDDDFIFDDSDDDDSDSDSDSEDDDDDDDDDDDNDDNDDITDSENDSITEANVIEVQQSQQQQQQQQPPVVIIVTESPSQLPQETIVATEEAQPETNNIEDIFNFYRLILNNRKKEEDIDSDLITQEGDVDSDTDTDSDTENKMNPNPFETRSTPPSELKHCFQIKNNNLDTEKIIIEEVFEYQKNKFIMPFMMIILFIWFIL